MGSNADSKIRERAYELWIEAGRPENSSDEHWHQAERELAASSDSAATGTSVTPKATGRSAKKAEAPPAKTGAKSAQKVGGPKNTPDPDKVVGAKNVAAKSGAAKSGASKAASTKTH